MTNNFFHNFNGKPIYFRNLQTAHRPNWVLDAGRQRSFAINCEELANVVHFGNLAEILFYEYPMSSVVFLFWSTTPSETFVASMGMSEWKRFLGNDFEKINWMKEGF